MNPELLKRVAEKMGGESVDYIYIKEGKVLCCDVLGDTPVEDCVEFNPSENPAQLVEMIEWLLERDYLIYKRYDTKEYVVNGYLGNYCNSYNKASTLIEACLLAIDGEE